MTANSERLERARTALEGLSVADAFGSHFEFAPEKLNQYLPNRSLPAPPWFFTDDTNMALSVFWMLKRAGGIDQGRLIESFVRHFDVQRGYGSGAARLLRDIRAGGDWRELSVGMFGGQGSYGNGAAMRIAPLGAYFADDLNMLIQQATLAAQVTHSHSEGIAGGVATALAAAFAWRYQGEAPPPPSEFLSQIARRLPPSDVRQGIEHAATLPRETPIETLISQLGNGSGVSAQDTVPLTLWIAAHHLDNYAEAIWLTLSVRGDVDTNAAIVGGIVASYTGLGGIPAEWIFCREPLPAWPFVV